jgi:hypothetical protein
MRAAPARTSRLEPLPISQELAQQQASLGAIRRLLTSRLMRDYSQHRVLTEAFALLRGLRPGQEETAVQCHLALLRELRTDAELCGFVDMRWADVPRQVFNFLDARRWAYSKGEWSPPLVNPD